jgi:hypothetical protein
MRYLSILIILSFVIFLLTIKGGDKYNDKPYVLIDRKIINDNSLDTFYIFKTNRGYWVEVGKEMYYSYSLKDTVYPLFHKE